MKKEAISVLIWAAAIVGFVVWLRHYSVPWVPTIFIAWMAGSGVNGVARIYLGLLRNPNP
jgi:hypothetical protein